MTDQHPITPPPPLVQRLRREAPHGIRDAGVTRELHLIHAAYRWGWGLRGEANEAELQEARDQELDACCEWLGPLGIKGGDALHAARRPKPPSWKKEALVALGPEPLPEPGPTGDTILNAGAIERHRLIRRALEQLND